MSAKRTARILVLIYILPNTNLALSGERSHSRQNRLVHGQTARSFAHYSAYRWIRNCYTLRGATKLSVGLANYARNEPNCLLMSIYQV